MRLANAVARIRAVCPDYGRRRLAFIDVRAAVDEAGLRLKESEFGPDGYIMYTARTITIRAGLGDPWRVFVGFHELGHWFAHRSGPPFHELERRRDWCTLDRLEREAVAWSARRTVSATWPYTRTTRRRGASVGVNGTLALSHSPW
jgi:hypothetical protein